MTRSGWWGGAGSEAGAGDGKIRSRRRVLLLAIVLAALVVPGAVFGRRAVSDWLRSSPRFAIVEVRVEGARRLAAEALADESGVALGSNLFRLDLDATALRLAADAWVAEARVARRLPGTVVIRVVEREPVALLPLGEWHALDPDGHLMPVAALRERLELPLVSGCFIGGSLDADALRRAGRFLRDVAADSDFLLRDVSEVDVKDPGNLTIYTVRSGTAVRLGDGNYAEKIERLLLVLQDLSGRDRVPLSIDLRYRGQAVVKFRGA